MYCDAIILKTEANYDLQTKQPCIQHLNYITKIKIVGHKQRGAIVVNNRLLTSHGSTICRIENVIVDMCVFSININGSWKVSIHNNCVVIDIAIIWIMYLIIWDFLIYPKCVIAVSPTWICSPAIIYTNIKTFRPCGAPHVFLEVVRYPLETQVRKMNCFWGLGSLLLLVI